MSLCRELLSRLDGTLIAVGGGVVKASDMVSCSEDGSTVSFEVVYLPVRSVEDITPTHCESLVKEGLPASVIISLTSLDGAFGLLDVQVQTVEHREYHYLVVLDSELLDKLVDLIMNPGHMVCKARTRHAGELDWIVTSQAFIVEWEELVKGKAVLLSSVVEGKYVRPGLLAELMRRVWNIELVENLSEALSKNNHVTISTARVTRLGNSVGVNLGPTARSIKGKTLVRYEIKLDETDTEKPLYAYLLKPMD